MEYPPVFPPQKPARRRPLRFQMLCAVFFLLFILTVKYCWPAGTSQLQQYLLPDHSTGITEQSFSELISGLQDGIPFTDAVTAFCREVVANADLME
jgi:hypothetical protein